MSDLFDLCDVTDIPEEIKVELNKDPFGDHIVELFNIANRNLSVDQVTVGYYRRFHEVKTKRQIMTKLYNMAHDITSSIESVPGKKGIYRKKDNENNCIEELKKEDTISM